MLIKNVVRTFRKKWLQLAAVGLIVILSSMLYTLMSYVIKSIEEPTLKYLRDYCQEDFSVDMVNLVTDNESKKPEVLQLLSQNIYALSDIKKNNPELFYELVNDRRKAFEDEYKGCTLELREYKVLNYEFKGKKHKALVPKAAEKINLTFIEEGTMPVRDGEIAVNRTYAEKNGLSIGGAFALNGVSYKITGYVLVPDYTYLMFDKSFNVDSELSALAVMPDSSYEKLQGTEEFRFSGLYAAGMKDAGFEREVIDTYKDKARLGYISSAAATRNQIRSGAIYSEMDQGRVMALGLGIFIAAIALIIVSIIIYYLLRAERGQIGVLKALGYKKREIALPYLIPLVVFAFFMLITGYILGTIFATPLKSIYLDFYLVPATAVKQNVLIFLTAIFLPLLFFTAVSGSVILRLLGTRALELLKPVESRTINALSKAADKILSGASGRTKFKYLYAIRNLRSFIVFFVGIMFATILINLSFMINGMVGRLTIAYLNKVDYAYEAYIDFSKGTPELRDRDEKFLLYPYGSVNGITAAVRGLEPGSSLYRLYDSQNRDRTGELENGVIISKMLSMKTDVNAGDVLQIKIGRRTYGFKVISVADEYISDAVYIDIHELSRILSDGKNIGLFSGIYSAEKPDGDSYNLIVSKDSIIDQSKAMNEYANTIVFLMIGGSAIIAICILYVLTSLTIENNYYVISLLKVMGYNRHEVNSMILGSYFVYALLSYIISLPLAILSLRLLMDFFVNEYGILLPMEYRFTNAVLGLLILVAIYFCGTFLSRRKIAKIPLQEILKAYRE